MDNNEFPVLKITNIEWSKNARSLEKLPKEIELGWGDKEWNHSDVSKWLSKEYNGTLNHLDITESGTWKDDGC